MTVETRCPSFIDLRALAAGTAAPAADAEPFGRDMQILPIRAGECEVGLFNVPAGTGTATETRGDAFVIATSGAVVLTDAAGSTELAAGQSCVINNGTAFSWSAQGPASLVFMRYLGARPGTRGITFIDNAAPLSPSGSPAADLLTSAAPSCRANSMFISDDEAFKCGVWDSTPYSRKALFFHHCELMHLLDGEASFIDDDGNAATFRKGDTFIIEHGANTTWNSPVNVTKIYATWRRPA
ncbi:cupin domain-containing protein [Novosphingobium colocasiae]|uniref:cupin domain-containing protein n=1 Tax=Novosphingobium colocasiae TaxID=1256513 RepID=UPI0035B1530A